MLALAYFPDLNVIKAYRAASFIAKVPGLHKIDKKRRELNSQAFAYKFDTSFDKHVRTMNLFIIHIQHKR